MIEVTDHGDGTATLTVDFYASVPPRVVGPMPLRMARDWRLFLTGHEPPHDPSGRQATPMRPGGARLSDRDLSS